MTATTNAIRTNSGGGLVIPQDMALQVSSALHEDIGQGDVTASLMPERRTVNGIVVTREDAVICGKPWVTETFRQLDPRVTLEWNAIDGEVVAAGTVVFCINGPSRSVLTGERTALNFLQLLSGTATETRRFADSVAGCSCVVLDTRKTIPGLRTAQKYAVRCGGAQNHRMGLYDMILIKENHIEAGGSITAAIAAARQMAPQIPVEVEVESLEELEEALAARPDIIMLDDFTLSDMRTAVVRNRDSEKPTKLEASGGVDLKTIVAIAETGVDFVSIGSMTKHVRAIDFSMRLNQAIVEGGI